MSHSEGPWNIERLSGECNECDDTCTHTIDIRSHGRHVASILGPIWDNDEANARLIVAAPKLLEVLKVIMVEYETALCELDDTNDVSEYAAVQAGHAAIGKAEGTQ